MWGTGPFTRAKHAEPELVVGTWALIGDDYKQPINRARSTNNARWETIDKLKTYKGPWARGQRCLIPAERFDYPNWESGKNEWWTFRRSDGEPWHLAGIWNSWNDPETGEVFESYSMVTMNCDAHPLLNRFHKPDPDLAPRDQDKRTVVPIDVADHRAWLAGSMEEASALVKLQPVELPSVSSRGCPHRQAVPLARKSRRLLQASDRNRPGTSSARYARQNDKERRAIGPALGRETRSRADGNMP